MPKGLLPYSTRYVVYDRGVLIVSRTSIDPDDLYMEVIVPARNVTVRSSGSIELEYDDEWWEEDE